MMKINLCFFNHRKTQIFDEYGFHTAPIRGKDNQKSGYEFIPQTVERKGYINDTVRNKSSNIRVSDNRH